MLFVVQGRCQWKNASVRRKFHPFLNWPQFNPLFSLLGMLLNDTFIWLKDKFFLHEKDLVYNCFDHSLRISYILTSERSVQYFRLMFVSQKQAWILMKFRNRRISCTAVGEIDRTRLAVFGWRTREKKHLSLKLSNEVFHLKSRAQWRQLKPVQHFRLPYVTSS